MNTVVQYVGPQNPYRIYVYNTQDFGRIRVWFVRVKPGNRKIPRDAVAVFKINYAK